MRVKAERFSWMAGSSPVMTLGGATQWRYRNLMRFPPQILDEIRARLPVSEVVGRRVKLKKQGREWAGLSPFNAEKSPSFFVNDQKGFYHDFSSGRHGDIFKFLQETEGLSFPEAVERLASLAGIDLPKATPEMAQEAERRKDLYDATEAACLYYEGRLQTSAGEAARAYLTKRGLSNETQNTFRIGFAPDTRDGLKSHLLAKGFTEDQLLRAGLTILPEDGRASYDRFRGRLMIPIQDSKGRVVAFGGRTLMPDGKPKYLNSSENELFHKGSMVFNAHRARPAAHDAGTVVVTEGYMDAISVYQAGFKAVVATLGTAFTEDQIQTLWRFAEEPIICFDGDRAGQAAAYRVIDRILPVLKIGNSFSFAYLPAGQDPDDLIKSGGLPLFRQVLSAAKPLWDVIWQRETAEAAIERPEQRAILEKKLFDLLRNIKEPTLLKHFQSMAGNALRELFRQHDYKPRKPLNWTPGKNWQPGQKTRPAAVAAVPTSVRRDDAEEILLGLCIEYPKIGRALRHDLARLHLTGAQREISHDDLLHEILRLYDEQEPPGASAIYSHAGPEFTAALDAVHGAPTQIQPYGHRLFARYAVLAQEPSGHFIEQFFELFCDKIILRHLEKEMSRMVTDIGEDEDAFTRIAALRGELHLLQEKIHSREHQLGEEASLYRGQGQEGL